MFYQNVFLLYISASIKKIQPNCQRLNLEKTLRHPLLHQPTQQPIRIHSCTRCRYFGQIKGQQNQNSPWHLTVYDIMHQDIEYQVLRLFL